MEKRFPDSANGTATHAGHVIMEAENQCRRKNKKVSSNFYVPPPARKSENIPRLVSHEHKTKERLEKLKCENENMKICNNSSLLFKSDETGSRPAHNSQSLIKKKRKRKLLKNDNVENLLVQNVTVNREIMVAADCHSLDEEISGFSDLSIHGHINILNSNNEDKLAETVSGVDESIAIQLQAVNDEINDSVGNSFDIHSVVTSLDNSSENVSYDSSTNQLNISATLEDIADIGEYKNEFNENNKDPVNVCENFNEIPISAKFPEETLSLKSNKPMTGPLKLSNIDEVHSGPNEDWEKLLDEEELHNFVAKSEISRNITIMKKSSICSEEKESYEERETNDSSIIEIYGFPEEFKTQDLYASFSLYVTRGFQLKWVDNTHALGIFSSSITADEVLSSGLPFVKTRPLSQATQQSKEKAKNLILPSTSRPKTCTALARRLVSGALGVRAVFTPAEIKAEREILKEAREQRRLAAKQRDAAWEGKF